MSSARPTRPSPLHTTSRRGLLRGGVALGITATASLASAGPSPAASRGAAAPGESFPRAEWVPADPSNFTVANRPSDYRPRYVIIHVTQEVYADAIKIFKNPAKDVSIHYLLRSKDGHVAQTVHEKDIAWHAGDWDYNTQSIGIEHEGFVSQAKWFTDAMYKASAKVTAAVCDAYGTPKDRTHIIGHSEVPGSTHTDPGPHWDWNRYMALVKGN
jgi:N-acetylmuramoyl-L-alanine amidase